MSTPETKSAIPARRREPGEKPRQPLYQEIADKLVAAIAAGDYAVGSLLPTEAQLCEEFKASRHTVREALRLIAEQRLIVRRAGAGSVVSASRPPSTFVYSISDLSEILKYPSETYRVNKSVKLVKADRRLAALIDCPVGKEWLRIRGIRKSDASPVPICWSDIYILPKYERVLEPPDSRTPVYEAIERKFGTSIHEAVISMSATTLAERVAEALEVSPGTAALQIVRRYTDASGETFETTVTLHPEDRFIYSMKMQRS